MFNIGNVGLSFYAGVIAGFGKEIGPYGTGGLIIGSEPDIGIGGGVHVGKRAGFGVLIPVRKVFENPGVAEAMNRAYETTISFAHHLPEYASSFHSYAASVLHSPHLVEAGKHVYEILSRL